MKTAVLATGLALACVYGAWASPWNKKTTIEIKESMLIPGKQLPPGKYVMKLLDSPSNRHIVQIFNADETKVEATILAIPNQRLQPTGDTAIGFWETPAGSPPALRSWFYPGDNFGQEFAYPKQMAERLAAANHTTVPWYAGEDVAEYQASDLTGTDVHDAPKYTPPAQTAEAPKPEPTPAPAPEPSVTESAAVTQSPAPLAKPEPAPRDETLMAQNNPPQNPPAATRDESRTPDTLPQTATPYGLMLLAGAGLFVVGRALAARA